MTEIGKALKALRKARRLTLLDVEQRTGIKTGYLSQVETGRIMQPGIDNLMVLSACYGVPIDHLMSLAGMVQASDARVEPLPLLPGFVIEAASVFTPEDWEALRGIIAWMLLRKG